MRPLSRRELLALGLASAVSPVLAAPPPVVNHSHIPPWRGFNLPDMVNMDAGQRGPFREQDFDWIAGWGFDFVRLPLDYRLWQPAPGQHYEAALRMVDNAIGWGRARHIHVNICLHRAPGYFVNGPQPGALWADGPDGNANRAQFALLWRNLAERWQHIPHAALSFNLLNEPSRVDAGPYKRALVPVVQAIREVDAGRLLIADGLNWGYVPVPELVPLRVAQSTRGYMPFPFSHYGATWVGDWAKSWPVPDWPYTGDGGWDKARLWRDTIVPWKQLEAQGVGVHIGEWGVYNHTPHTAALRWMRDRIDGWREAGWGWALWNLHGPFGILDSLRPDAKYEPFHGFQLDRRMLEVLRGG